MSNLNQNCVRVIYGSGSILLSGNPIRYALPVLSMTPFAHNGQEKRIL